MSRKINTMAVLLVLFGLYTLSVEPDALKRVAGLIPLGAGLLLGCITSRLLRLFMAGFGLISVVIGINNDYPVFTKYSLITSCIFMISAFAFPALGPNGGQSKRDQVNTRYNGGYHGASGGGSLFWIVLIGIFVGAMYYYPGFRHWFISAFKFDSPQNEMPLASSGPQYKETDAIQKHIGTADDSRNYNSRQPAAEMSGGYSGQVKEKAVDSPDDLLAQAKALVGSNSPAAIPLLEKASRLGNADSSFELARIYAKGLCGSTTNDNSMEQWLIVAREQGHVRAGSMLDRRQQQTQRLNRTWRKYWDGESFSADQYLSADEIERGKREIAIVLQECPEASSWVRQQAQHHLDFTMACTMKTVGSGSRSSGPSRQPQADSIRPSGSPPRWQVREGQTRPDGVRTFEENQFLARHDGRRGGAFDTTREASFRAETLNIQQRNNQEAMMEKAMYSGRDGNYMLNSRSGNWTYKYDETIDKFVVYQE